MRRTVAVAAIFVLLASASSSWSGQNTPAHNLKIYWVDVEGGAATLFVSPTGESLLFDTGFPGNGDRDAKRIHAAVQKAGLKQIDQVVLSHWHGDHVGGLEALGTIIPIGRFLASVGRDGRFTLMNTRNGFSKILHLAPVSGSGS